MKNTKYIRNRNITALCLCTALLFSLIGCSFSDQEEKDSVEVLTPGNVISSEDMLTPFNKDTEVFSDTEPFKEESETAEEISAPKTDEDAEEASALAELLREELPRMDGSTSAIPLEAAIRRGIFGISRGEAQEDVRHSSSHTSFNNLLDKKCSLVFSHLLSPEQYETAERRGIAIEMTPIAREGFIFLVSAENPVESLTSDEVKRIYTGEITNWSEVGGEDMPITAYQRNIDSGSQNYMRAFMGDLPLTDAPTELRPSFMDTLVDCVAAYDGEKNGIGYSVFSYVGGMYDAEGGVKLLKIDGVEPTYETICDGTYPCTGYNYVVIRADEAEDSPARNLLAWTLSSAGQRSIAETGYYAPLLPTSGIGISIADLHLMTVVGTGKETCTPADWCYYIEMSGRPYESGYPDGKHRLPVEGTNKTNVFDYSGNILLPETGNAVLDEEITAFAKESFAALEKVCLRGDIHDKVFYPYSNFACVNGYLSVSVGIDDSLGVISSAPGMTAMWDLESGKRLVLSDLFCRDAAFVPILNSAVRRFAELDPGFSYIDTALTVSAFEGLTEGFDNFGLAVVRKYEDPNYERGLSFFLGFHPDNNPYFANDVIVPVAVQESDLCLLCEPRSFGGAFGEESRVLWQYSLGTQRSTYIPVNDGDYGKPYTYSAEYRWTEFEGFPGSDKINEAQRAYREKHSDPGAEIWTDEFVHRVGAEMADILLWNNNLVNPTAEQLGTARVIVEETAYPLGSRYAAVSYLVRVQHLDWVGYGGGVYLDRKCVIYDLETGEEVPFSEIFSLPYDGIWNTSTADGEFPDVNLLGDPVYIWNGTYPGRLTVLFEPVPGERYSMEIRHDALRIFDAQ